MLIIETTTEDEWENGEFPKYTYFNRPSSPASCSDDCSILSWMDRQAASQSKQAPNQHIIHHKNGSKPLSKIDIVAASGDDTALCTGHERIDIDPVTMARVVLVLLDYSIMWVVRHFYAASSAAVASPRRNYMDPFHNAAFLPSPPPQQQRHMHCSTMSIARLTSGLSCKRYKSPDVIWRSGQFNSINCSWESVDTTDNNDAKGSIDFSRPSFSRRAIRYGKWIRISRNWKLTHIAHVEHRTTNRN